MREVKYPVFEVLFMSQSSFDDCLLGMQIQEFVIRCLRLTAEE
jgi:hypothetical protein